MTRSTCHIHRSVASYCGCTPRRSAHSSVHLIISSEMRPDRWGAGDISHGSRTASMFCDRRIAPSAASLEDLFGDRCGRMDGGACCLRHRFESLPRSRRCNVVARCAQKFHRMRCSSAASADDRGEKFWVINDVLAAVLRRRRDAYFLLIGEGRCESEWSRRRGRRL